MYEQILVRILQAVENSNLSKAEIASKLEIKESILERYLTGDLKISLPFFANLCRVLKIDANKILVNASN